MNSGDKKFITVAIYTHPELYPPLLNAIDELSKIFSFAQIIARNLETSVWKYPSNVQLIISGTAISIRESERASTGWKIKSFVRFTIDLYKSMKHVRSEWMMCNDVISLFSFRLIRPFLGYPVKLWYHSHDVAELKSMRRYSVGYFAVKSEKKHFNRIDLFTLPSEARLEFFPMERFKGKTLIVPNYPSLQRMDQDQKTEWKSENDLKLLYQGRVSNEHGLEEIIDIIKTDPSLRLTIVGPGDEMYKQKLRNRISEMGINFRVSMLEPVPYAELREITLDHHIGLAINKPVNLLYATAVMASNKIYEYAAAGLPILYYKNLHYLEFLKGFTWAFPSDLTFTDIQAIIGEVKKNYKDLSNSARKDFRQQLNFEIVFRPVISWISRNGTVS